ncbi:MAG: hypothetical protein HEEMFOPI_00660 [Holosporales bacterium]
MTYCVKDIRDFYHSSLGAVVKSEISNVVLDFLPPSLKDKTILGMGYAVPYLDEGLFLNNTVLSFMSDSFGGHPWPNTPISKVALIHDWLIPLKNHSVDYIVMVHSVEFTAHIQSYFQEVWRILKKDGKILIILPSRLSFWSVMENTPFGFGHPYTMTQGLHLLEKNGFVETKQKRLLYNLPIQSSLIRSFFKPIEWLGPYLFKKLAGVNIIFAEKKTFSFSFKTIKETALEAKPTPST